jgi:PAS domain S-box-containing protein
MADQALDSGAVADPRWRTLVRAGPFYVAAFDPDGRLTFLNRSRSPLGPTEFLGCHFSELFPSGDGPDLEAAFRAVVDRGEPQRIEVPARLDDDRVVWLELHLLPVSEDGRTSSILAVGIDVSAANQTALELRMSVNALHRVIESREQLEADLHDGILQSLYGVGLRLEAARAALVAVGGEADVHLDRAIEQIRETMTEVRRYIAEGPATPPSPAVNWDEALTGLLRGLEVEGGPTIDLELDRDAVARLPGPAQSQVAFIAREAVSNAVRHAHASRVVVRLLDDGPRVRLEVEDDGRGFPRERAADGFGLLTMARRAALIRALLGFQTVPGRGTLVRLDLPVAEDGPAGD